MRSEVNEHALDSRLIADFVSEAEEHLDRVDDVLLELEKVGCGKGLHAEALRALHSVKGSAGYLDLFDIQAYCHSGEELLEGIDAANPTERAQRIDQAFNTVTQLRTALLTLRRGQLP